MRRNIVCVASCYAIRSSNSVQMCCRLSECLPYGGHSNGRTVPSDSVAVTWAMHRPKGVRGPKIVSGMAYGASQRNNRLYVPTERFATSFGIIVLKGIKGGIDKEGKRRGSGFLARNWPVNLRLRAGHGVTKRPPAFHPRRDFFNRAVRFDGPPTNASSLGAVASVAESSWAPFDGIAQVLRKRVRISTRSLVAPCRT